MSTYCCGGCGSALLSEKYIMNVKDDCLHIRRRECQNLRVDSEKIHMPDVYCDRCYKLLGVLGPNGPFPIVEFSMNAINKCEI